MSTFQDCECKSYSKTHKDSPQCEESCKKLNKFCIASDVTVGIFFAAAVALAIVYTLVWKKRGICKTQICTMLATELKKAQEQVALAQKELGEAHTALNNVKVDQTLAAKALAVIKKDVQNALHDSKELLALCSANPNPNCAKCIGTAIKMNSMLNQTRTDIHNLKNTMTKANATISAIGTTMGKLGGTLSNLNAAITVTETNINLNMKYSNMLALNMAELKSLTNQMEQINAKIQGVQANINGIAPKLALSKFKKDSFADQTALLTAYDADLKSQITYTTNQKLAAEDAVRSFKNNLWYGISVGNQAYALGMYYSPPSTCPVTLRRPNCGSTADGCTYECNPQGPFSNPVFAYAMGGNTWWNQYCVLREIGGLLQTADSATSSNIIWSAAGANHMMATAVLENQWTGCGGTSTVAGLFVSGFLTATGKAIGDVKTNTFDPEMFLWVGTSATDKNSLPKNYTSNVTTGATAYVKANSTLVKPLDSTTTKQTDLKTSFSTGKGASATGNGGGPLKAVIEFDFYSSANRVVISYALFEATKLCNTGYTWSTTPSFVKKAFSVPADQRMHVGVITSQAPGIRYVSKFSGLAVGASTGNIPGSSTPFSDASDAS